MVVKRESRVKMISPQHPHRVTILITEMGNVIFKGSTFISAVNLKSFKATTVLFFGLWTLKFCPLNSPAQKTWNCGISCPSQGMVPWASRCSGVSGTPRLSKSCLSSRFSISTRVENRVSFGVLIPDLLIWIFRRLMWLWPLWPLESRMHRPAWYKYFQI